MKRNSRSVPPQEIVLFLIVVSFALRMYMLDYFSLRGDESFTVLFVLKPFAQMWNEIRTVEPNPPLMYLLLRVWIALAGASEFATRFFSVFWGVLCVPLIYRLALSLAPSPGPRLPAPLYSSALRGSATNEGEGRGGQWKKRDSFEGTKDRRRGNAMALTAALLVTINPYQIWHSQDVRNYAMWPALSLLAILFFWLWTHPYHVPDRTPPPLILGGFILAELAALYTHYYEAFILIALNLYALFFFVRRRAWTGGKSASLLQWVGVQVILAFLYLPFPLIISNRVASYGEGSGQQGVALWDIWQRTFSVFTLGETIDESLRRFLWIPFALALVVIVIARWRHERRGVFFLLYAGVPTLAVFLLNLVRPLFLERYLNGIAPAYYLLFAWGISALAVSPYPSWIRRGVTSLALAGFAVLAMMALANYFYNPVYAKSPDWRALARAIDAESRKGDVILQNFQETSLVYYDHSGLPLVVYPLNYLPDAQTARALDSLNGKFQRIWFVPSSNQYWDPYQYVEGWLDRYDDLLAETRAANFRLELYGTPKLFLTTMHPLDASVDKLADLVGYRLDRQGPVWHVVLYWRPQTTTKKSLKVFVQLVASESSQVLAQVDRLPVNGTFPTNQWRRGELIVDQYDLPFSPAAKAVAVGMFDPGTSFRLPILDAMGNQTGDLIMIPLSTSP